jgi:hypothetical protein
MALLGAFTPKTALPDNVDILNPRYRCLLFSIPGIDGFARGCYNSGIDGSAMRLLPKDCAPRQRGYSQSQVEMALQCAFSLKTALPDNVDSLNPRCRWLCYHLCAFSLKTAVPDNVDSLNPRCRWFCYVSSPQRFCIPTMCIFSTPGMDSSAEMLNP